mgnify:CR=1 FL=1
MSQQVVHELRKKALPVKRSCELLGISRAAYYAAQGRVEAKPCVVMPVLKAAFSASGRTYGSRRLVSDLRERGVTIGRFRVRRMMREAGIKPVWKRKFVHTTNSQHHDPIAPNVLNRQFDPPAPNQAWATDITYVRTRSGWLYLAIVLDLYSRKLIGWASSNAMPAELVCRALRIAIQQRAPQPGLIVHSDRGSQYASKEYQALLQRHQFVCSMSRLGNCWDNAVAERFFLNLKMERVWQRDYANHAEAKGDIADYIVNFYNERRLSSKLNYMSPNHFEKNAKVA